MLRRTAIAITFLFVSGCANNQATEGVAYTPFTDYPVAKAKLVSALDLTKMINSLGGAQKQFERDSDFQTRVSSIAPFEVCREASVTRLRFDSKTGRTLYKEFLTDAQVAGFREVNGETFTDPTKNFPSMELAFESTKVGEFVGQNALGAAAVVDVRLAESVHLVFDPMPVGGLVFPHPYFSADATGADQAGDTLQLCMTLVPVEPFYRESVRHGSPTISNPSMGEVTHKFFRVKIGSARLADLKGNTLTERVLFDPGVY